jgi:hypothetical protein
MMKAHFGDEARQPHIASEFSRGLGKSKKRHTVAHDESNQQYGEE